MKTLRTHPAARLLLGLFPLAMLVGCESGHHCTPTVTTVSNASLVDVKTPARSGILEARLTGKGRALPQRGLTFWVERRDLAVAGDAYEAKIAWPTTGGDGFARFDLKTRRDIDLARDAFAKRYGAWFSGDQKYCASQGTGSFEQATVSLSGPQVPPDRNVIDLGSTQTLVERARTGVIPAGHEPRADDPVPPAVIDDLLGRLVRFV